MQSFIPFISNIGKPGRVLTDFLGRFENMNEDWKKICKEINIKLVDLPHINKSSHKNYTEYYDNNARKKVARLYSKDIKLFGYKFEKS